MGLWMFHLANKTQELLSPLSGRTKLAVGLFPVNRLCCANRLMAEVPLSPDGLIPLLP
jgi:hypothetical protein